ncbi:MAG TPA: hypothetical protein PL131_05420 [Methylotenera sp.]|nr:hypothetical protein [Methylotenera sp.]HPH05294.1 hypothetical protein [Methylotenera sp.]HPN00196.1 hypothetical protein [Methylotenera sp.]
MKANQPVSLIRILLLFVIVVSLAFWSYQIWDSDYVYLLRKHYLSEDTIILDFNKLEPISIQEAQKSYKLNWWCGNNDLLDFGEKFCADELKGWDDIPAMLVVFWFKKEKLNMAKIDIPLWHHSKVIEKIKSEYGEPIHKSRQISYLIAMKKLGLLVLTKGKLQDSDEVYVENRGIWELKTGGWIETELKQNDYLFTHNTVLWYSPEAVKQIKSLSTMPSKSK